MGTKRSKMAIQYGFFRQGGVFEGKNKVIARAIEGRAVESTQLFEEIEASTSLSTSDLLAAVDALTDALRRQLLMGNSVHIKGLGYFSLTIDGEVTEKEKERFYLKQPKVKSVRFRAEKSFLQGLAQEAQFKATHHGCKSQRELTEQELNAVLDRLMNGAFFFSAPEFAREAGCTLPHAYQLLRRLIAAGKVKDISTSPRRKMYSRA